MASTQESIWVDGLQADTLPLPDRGFDFGDGLFETLLVVNGAPLFLNLHLQRLRRGLTVLGFPDCLNHVSNHISHVIQSLSPNNEWSMRVTVTRGSGPRGYPAPVEVRPRTVISATARVEHNFGELLFPAHLGLAQTRWGQQPLLAGIKHLNRLEQVLGANERRAMDVDEVVMLDQQGQVISVSSGNLFVVIDNRIVTPELTHCGVLGTRRRLVLEQLAAALGMPAVEKVLSLSGLRDASEVFYCNALVGLRPVSSFETVSWDRHPVCAALHQLYVQRTK